MPNLREAYVDIEFPDIKNLIRSITSVKCLTICSKAMYGEGFVFNQLEHLKLCVSTDDSLNYLARLLKDSPNLQVLDLFRMEGHSINDMICWNQPSIVPECMLSTLQTFNWLGYSATKEKRDLVVYILKNACRLKTATISTFACLDPQKKIEMITELALSSRASTTCQLVFDFED